MSKPQKTEIKVPFKNLTMLEYVSYDNGSVEWRVIQPFKARIEVTGHWRGRSSARIACKNLDNGEIYSMGLASFYDAIQLFGAAEAKHGLNATIKGNWSFRKQGSNYSLFPVDTASKTD